jgi:uncharacterized protein
MIRPITCPICRKPLPISESGLPATFPFCSKRCRDVDFFRWSEGKYAIAEPLDPQSLDAQSLDEQLRSQEDKTAEPPIEDYPE